MNILLAALLISPLLLALDLWTAPRPDRRVKLKGRSL